MRTLRVTNTRRGVLLGSQVKLAERWWARLRGFLGRPAPKAGEGLLLTPCRAVHTYGMRFSLDVVFLDRDGVVVALYERMAPASRTKMEPGAWHALELPAGAIAATGTVPGDRIAWSPANNEPTNGRETLLPRQADGEWQGSRRGGVSSLGGRSRNGTGGSETRHRTNGRPPTGEAGDEGGSTPPTSGGDRHDH